MCCYAVQFSKKPAAEREAELQAKAAAVQEGKGSGGFSAVHHFGQGYQNRAESVCSLIFSCSVEGHSMFVLFCSEEAQKIQLEREKQAQERAEELRQNTRGMRMHDWESMEQHRQDLHEQRQRRAREARPFDMLDQARVLWGLSNDYKARWQQTNAYLMNKPIEGRYTEDFAKRWEEADEDSKPDPTDQDIIYDPPIFAVRPGMWGAFCAFLLSSP